jgi:hypothetical protein
MINKNIITLSKYDTFSLLDLITWCLSNYDTLLKNGSNILIDLKLLTDNQKKLLKYIIYSALEDKYTLIDILFVDNNMKPIIHILRDY